MKFRKSLIAILIAILSLATMAFAGCALTVSSDSENDASEVESPSGSEETPITYEITVSGGGEVAHNGTAQITAYVDGADDAEFAFSSSNESVVTVDGDGLATGHAAGSAIITVTASSEAKGFNDLTGEVEITVKHAFGEWTYVTAPTLESAGEAKRTCEYDGEEETAVAPALSDESWSISEEKSVAPTYLSKGQTVYEHETFPDVTIETDPVAAPAYVGKSYVITKLYQSGSYTYYNMGDIAVSSMDEKDFSCTVTAYNSDEDSNVNVDFWSTGAVINGHDAADGSFTVIYGGKEYTAYVDETSAIIAYVDRNCVHVLVPTDHTDGRGADEVNTKFRDGSFTFIAFNDADYVINYDDVLIYVHGDILSFAPVFKDTDGKVLAYTDLGATSTLEVYVGDEMIEEYARKNGTLTALDGVQGEYTATLRMFNGETHSGTAVLNGIGGIEYRDENSAASGEYTLADFEKAGFYAEVYFKEKDENVAYYQILVLGDDALTLYAPSITVTYVLNGGAIDGLDVIEGNSYEKFNVNVKAAFATPVKDGYIFKGWYFDEEFERSVETVFPNGYLPFENEDIDLFAKWSAKRNVRIVYGEESGLADATAQVADGTVLSENDYLPQGNINGKVFDHWYVLDGENEVAYDFASAITDDITIYAAWRTESIFQGTYKGVSNWLTGSMNGSNDYTLTVAADGTYASTSSANSTTNGSFGEYDAETGVIQTVYRDTQTVSYYDAVNKVLFIREGVTSERTMLYFLGATSVKGSLDGKYGSFRASNWCNKEAFLYTVTITKDGVESDVNVFVFNGKIYYNVSWTVSGTTTDNTNARFAYSADTVVITTASGEKLKFYKEDGALVFFDGEEVSYTKDGEEDIFFDGIGYMTYGDKDGTYAAAGEDADYDYDVYFFENGVATEYYQLTVDEEAKTYSVFEKVMANIEYHYNGHGGEDATLQANINIAIALPTPENEDGVIFRAWYTDAEFEGTAYEAGAAYTPVGNVAFYAKYDVIYTFTVIYGENSGIENASVSAGAGDVLDEAEFKPVGFNAENKVFAYWYVLVNDEEVEYSFADPITADTTVYVAWKIAAASTGTYRGGNYYSSSGDSKTLDSFTSTSYYVTVSSSGEINFRGTFTQISDDEFDVSDGVIHVKNTQYAYFNGELGIFWSHYNANSTTGVGDDTLIAFDVDRTASVDMSGKKYTIDGVSRYIAWVTVTFKDGSVKNGFLYKDVIYANVTWTEGVSAKDAYKSNLIIYDSEGEPMVALVGGSFKDFDGYQGTYTKEDSADIVLDGVGSFVYGEESGTYAVAADDADYTFDAYILSGTTKTVYYQLTVDKDAHTYTMTAPTVTVNYNYNGHGGENAELDVNKNIAISLPAPTDETGCIFRGWYLNEEFTGAKYSANASYTPTQDVTFYAKWDVTYTFTVIYGENSGIETKTATVGDGDTPTQSTYKPTALNAEGKVFDYWATDADGANTYTWSKITADTTIYAIWKDAHVMYGNWYGVEVYGSGNASTTYGPFANKSLTVNAEGVASGTKSGTITDYDPTTGSFKLGNYYGYFDATNRIIVLNDSSNKALADADDIYVFLPLSSSADVAQIVNSNGSSWNAGKNKLFAFNVKINGEMTAVSFYYDHGMLYNNVSVKDAKVGGSDIAVNEAYKKSVFYIFASNGNLIASWGKSGDAIVALTGVEGNYSDGDKTLAINAGATLTYNGNTAAYTVLSDNVVAADMTDAYYEFTLDIENLTFTANIPCVTITLNANGGTFADTDGVAANGEYSININHDVTLPVPTKDNNVFRGFADADGNVYYTLRLTEGGATYTATWLGKVALTIVYGNGLDNVELLYGEGETVVLPDVGMVDGKRISGYYTLSGEEHIAYTPAAITADTTIYAEWEEIPYTITTSGSYAWKFNESTGVWTSGNKGSGSTTSYLEITANGHITLTFEYNVSSESNWDWLRIYYQSNGSSTEKVKMSGTSNSYTVFTIELNAGDIVKLGYSKDSGGNSGDDTAYLRNISATKVVEE